MRVVPECHMHDHKRNDWCSFCQQKQIEDCQICHGKRLERISEIFSSRGNSRKEYLNALTSVMNHIYCSDCEDAQGFYSDKWPYDKEARERFEIETLKK